jgi:hypothetical protein
MTAPASDEEWRKRITATLSTGTTMIVIGNVDGVLSAPSLAVALTTNVWSDRLLGTSEMLTLAQRATWLATGNNIRPGGDLPGRCYRIRLDAKTSRPWQHTGFRYPDLLGWVGAHRHEYVAALLLLARAWYVAGEPAADIQMLGSFESWTRAIGGILAYAGIPGFLTEATSGKDCTLIESGCSAGSPGMSNSTHFESLCHVHAQRLNLGQSIGAIVPSPIATPPLCIATTPMCTVTPPIVSATTSLCIDMVSMPIGPTGIPPMRTGPTIEGIMAGIMAACGQGSPRTLRHGLREAALPTVPEGQRGADCLRLARVGHALGGAMVAPGTCAKYQG